MKITDIRVDGFGVWNELSVDELSDGVTLFFGKNEAGKTTLMQFLRAVLYGFSPDRRRLYLPPVYGGEPGGLLRVENHSGQFVIERRMSDRSESALGRVIVLAANGSRQGQHLLNVLLSGVDESIFNNVFAVGIRELQELATLDDTDAAELLYNLASGVDRVSLVEVMRELEAGRNRLLHAGNQPNHIGKLLARQEKLASEVADLETQTRRWSDLASERQALVTEVGQLEQRISQLEHDARAVEIAIKVRDRWLARRDVQQQLERCGELVPLPEGCLDRLDQLNLQVLDQTEHLKPLTQRRLELRRQLAAQPINRALWDESPRIEAICEHGPWIESLENEIRQLKRESEAFEVELLQHDEKLAAEGGVILTNSPVVSPRLVEQLQPAALALREASKKRVFVRKQQKKTRQEEAQATTALEQELSGKRAETLDQALERVGQLVNQLRRRVKMEDRLEQMWRQEEELEHEYEDLLDNQLQRMRLLIAIGFLFVFGFVLMLTGVFGWKIMPMNGEISWGVGFLGVVCIGLSAAWKMVLERTSQDELDECSRSHDTLGREIEDLIAQRDDLDKQLPKGPGTFSARLAAAERELNELEAMEPLHQERVDARKRIQDGRRQVSEVDEELREARSRWRRGLRQAGLPETLTPKHLRQLGSHHQKKSKIEEQLAKRRERIARLEADRNALVERLQKLRQDVGIQTASDDPQIQLSQLAAALAGQRGMVERRRELQRDEREVRKQLATGLAELRRLKRGREALFAEARVTDEAELRARVEQLQRAAALGDRQRTLTEQIANIVSNHCPDADIERELNSHTAEGLQHRGDDLLMRLHDSQTHLNQLHQRRGEINQEMKTLAENRRLSAARFELACTRQELVQAARQWRVSTLAWRLLEHVRETYEAERQPETLDEASLYLERLTHGKYARIWTPLGRHELRIDDAEGKQLPLDMLSRGTREAVFLSLRLALVASYRRRGINIPMVLDDVLVNLDAQRAEAAVEMLCDYAQGNRQLLFFTCHDHIREMFQRADVDVRVLPSHGSPGVRVGRAPRPIPKPQIAPTPAPVPAVAVEPDPAPEPDAEPFLIEQRYEEPPHEEIVISPPIAEPIVEDTFVHLAPETEPDAEPEDEGDYELQDDETTAPRFVHFQSFDLDEDAPLRTDESAEAELDAVDEEEETQVSDPVEEESLVASFADDVEEVFSEEPDDLDLHDPDGPWWRNSTNLIGSHRR